MFLQTPMSSHVPFTRVTQVFTEVLDPTCERRPGEPQGMGGAAGACPGLSAPCAFARRPATVSREPGGRAGQRRRRPRSRRRRRHGPRSRHGPFHEGSRSESHVSSSCVPELYKVNPAPEGTAVGGGLSGGGSVLLNGPRRAPAPPLPYSRLPFARSHPLSSTGDLAPFTSGHALI